MAEITNNDERTNFYTSLVKDKKELHLMSLGTRGGVYELIDGDYFKINVNDLGCISINDIKLNRNIVLLNFLQEEMFNEILKLKKKYGGFNFSGQFIYAPPSYYDEDGTVTIHATKYHKSRMGYLGTVFIYDINFTKEITPIDAEDCLNCLKTYFNIYAYKGFKCYIKEDLAVTIDYDNVIDIPSDTTIEDVTTKLIPQLIKTRKSILNGKLDIDCHVKGYTFTIDLQHSHEQSYFNNDWEELRKNYSFQSDVIFNELRNNSISNEDEWLSLIKNFWENPSIPKGVKENFKDNLIAELTKVDLSEFMKTVTKVLLIAPSH